MLDLIKRKYGSIDKMIEETNTFISRSYLYQICENKKTSISITYAQELIKLLELKSIDELLELLKD